MPTAPDSPRLAPTVAVIGGGQLARMLAEPAAALGIPLRLLAEAPGVSAAQVIPDHEVGDYTDLTPLRLVTDGCEVVTFDHEHVPTDHLHALEADGIRVLVPITRTDWDLDWREARGTGGTDAAALGVDAIARAGVVFVPAQAVDRSGTRLGRGKGCYDRALPRTEAMVIAVVHPWELADSPLPHDAHDRPVDAGLPADGVTTCCP